MNEQQQLKITALDGGPATEVRFYLPASWEAGTEGFVIMLSPVTPDNLLAVDETRYGSVRVLTDDGVRTVSTVSLGVLVVEE